MNKMRRISVLFWLISIICSTNSQQGQNFYFTGGGGNGGGGAASATSRQQTRFVPYQQNQFAAIPQQQQPFATYFQTNAGPYLPFRSPNFQLPTDAADDGVGGSTTFSLSDPRFDPLISPSGVYVDPGASNDDYADIGGYVDQSSSSHQSAAVDTAATPSQRFNAPPAAAVQQRTQPDRHSAQQFRSQLARLSPIAISEVTRTQDSPNGGANALQTHSFNVHHTTRDPNGGGTPPSRAAGGNRGREPDNFRGRNVVAFPPSAASAIGAVDATESSPVLFPKFSNRFAAAKKQTFLVNTQPSSQFTSANEDDDGAGADANSDGDSSYTQFVAHETYFSPPPTSASTAGKKKKDDRGKSSSISATAAGGGGAVRTRTNVTPTTSYVADDHRVRTATIALADSEMAATTFRAPQAIRGQGRARGKSVRPSDEAEKNWKKSGKVTAAAATTTTSSSIAPASDENDHFDVVTMSQEHLFVSEDNFKGFVDSASIDSTEAPVTDDAAEKTAVESAATTAPVSVSQTAVADGRKKTSSPNNGAKPTPTATTTEVATTARKSSTPRPTQIPFSTSTTTEGWIIVASVQTSRSVSGARFIPSSAIRQEQHPLPLDAKSIKDIKSHLGHKTNENASVGETSSHRAPTAIASKTTTVSTTKSSRTTSAEGVFDKSDQFQAQSNPTGAASYGEEHESDDTPSTRSSATTTSSADDDDTTKRRFVPSSKTTTIAAGSSAGGSTVKPKFDRKSLFDSIQFDDLTGLLPEGFKVRGTFTPSSKKPHHGGGGGGATGKSTTETSGGGGGVSTTERGADKSAKNKAATSLEKLKSKIKFDDVSRLLPPGYKLPASPTPPAGEGSATTTDAAATQSKTSPPQTPPRVPDVVVKAKPVDVNAFLPPGFQVPNARAVDRESASSTKTDSLLSRISFKETNDLLPTDYVAATTTTENAPSSSTTAAATKVVFPSRPGGSPKKPPASVSKNNAAAKSGIPSYQIPVIHRGWPVRATTEFAGWPSPSPSPISIEKVLQAAKEAATETNEESSTSSTTITSTTVTTTTNRVTTPGICAHDCDLAGSIKLIGGVKWVPELLDHNTIEWRTLANDVQHQLEVIFQSSETLSRWYRRITIDAFSPGSVIVDYFVELSDLGRTVNTADMKRLFHETLVEETVTSGSFALSNGSDYRQLKLGKFVVDATYTDFVVLPKSVMPAVRVTEQDMWLPQWAIAVIVIGLASLLFVLIFGITVIINRHKNAKKNPTALTEEMLNELNKNHMSGGFENYGADELYNMEDVWSEKHFSKKFPRANYYPEESMPNIYDSWRSDWNGYQYGNSCYNGSIRSGFSRRRSDYDTNF